MYGDSTPKPMQALKNFQLRRKPLLAIPISLEASSASLKERTRKALSEELAVQPVAPIPAPPTLLRPEFHDYAVQLVAPSHRSVSHNATVSFSWTPVPVPDVQYEINVSRDPDFKQSLWYPLKDNQVQADLMIKGDYYWRIKVRHGFRRNTLRIKASTDRRQVVSVAIRRIAQKLSRALGEGSHRLDKGSKNRAETIPSLRRGISSPQARQPRLSQQKRSVIAPIPARIGIRA